MILINLTILHSGANVGKVLGTPKNLEISVCENSSISHSSKTLPQQPPPASVRPPLNQNQQPYTSFGSVSNQPTPVVTTNTPQPVKQQQVTPTKSFYGAQANTKPYGNSPSFSGSSSPQTQITNRNVFPIASLNPYQNKLEHFND